MTNRRWMKSILKAAAANTAAMPWERGPVRRHSGARQRAESAKARLAGA